MSQHQLQQQSHRLSTTTTTTTSEPDRVIGVHKILPCKWNGRRTLATGLQPAFYACYTDRVELHYHHYDDVDTRHKNGKQSRIVSNSGSGGDAGEDATTRTELRIYLQALGEYNLANPENTLFCLLDATRQETWQSLAQSERRSPSDRFIRGEWLPQAWSLGDSAYSPCFHDGYLALPAPWCAVGMGRQQRQQRAFQIGHCYQLCMSYGAETPYKTDFAPQILLEMTVNPRGGRIEVSDPPRTQAPVATADDAWAVVFERSVRKRLLTAVQNITTVPEDAEDDDE